MSWVSFEVNNKTMVTGQTLIDLGYTPGKWFGEAIQTANEKNLEGMDLVMFLESRQPSPEILPHEKPKPYFKNLLPETYEDLENLKKVKATMDEVMRTPTVITGAIMPDACPAGPFGHVPVGSVVVTDRAIHPGMHSADVCCSMFMSLFNTGTVKPKDLLDAGHRVTHFGATKRKEFFPLHFELEEKMRNNMFLNDEKILRLAKEHLGTQGDGNHFLFVGTIKSNNVNAVVTHHGSRGVGANLYKAGMKVAERFRKEISPKTNPVNAWIPYDTNEGRAYWEALQIVREWTKLNHRLIHNSISLEVNQPSLRHVWNEHNFVFRKDGHFYHAKGATPMDRFFLPEKDRVRLIPLNMGQPILIAVAKDENTGLGFAPHGAGRNLSRTQHVRSLGERSVEEVLAEETKGLDIRFYSGKPDVSELPSAYKDANWLRDQIDYYNLAEITNVIEPYGSIMAGHQEFVSKRKKKSRD